MKKKTKSKGIENVILAIGWILAIAATAYLAISERREYEDRQKGDLDD